MTNLVVDTPGNEKRRKLGGGGKGARQAWIGRWLAS